MTPQVGLPERYFGWLISLLLAILGLTQLFSVLGENQSADEAVHLSAGYSYLKTGDFRINPEHPPLGKYINALPLLLLNPHLPTEDPSWADADEYLFGRAFLYKNTESADKLLLYGRIPTILMTLCLALAIGLWTRRHFNAATALFAVLLFSFDPTVITHGRYVTSDIIVSLLIFLSITAWFRYLREPARGSLIRAGVLLGLTLCSKASGVILLPMFAVLYLVAWWKKDLPAPSWKQLTLALGTCCVLGFLVIYAAYRFETSSVLADKALAKRFAMTSDELKADIHVSSLLRRLIDPATTLGKVTHIAARYIPIPAHSFLHGIYWQADRNKQGRDYYLLGQHSEKGRWYYFSVAFGVKTPVAVVLLLTICVVLVFWKFFSSLGNGLPALLRGIPLKWYALVIPMAVYLAATLASNVNIGIRHLLPIYPFLYILLSASFLTVDFGGSRKIRLAGALIIGAFTVAESAAAYPYYLPFFNVLAGGSAQGPRYLIDSNVDWGQDLKRLKTYTDSHGAKDLCLSYFGNVDPTYYGIVSRPLTEQAKSDTCDIAISVNALYSVETDNSWLHNKTPDARIGYSIYYYDRNKLK
ncbi:MAG: phospholipid carrier-dependent glycosyltransferase [Bryobacteraceae bacterium]